MIDIVTVYHNQAAKADAAILQNSVTDLPGVAGFFAVDNTVENRGFARGCNFGALDGVSNIIGFLNPDTKVHGNFAPQVIEEIGSGTTITGERFDKPVREIRIWGCRDWVCGAALFVERKWFESVGGFDERFVWSWEETALIRLAQDQGKVVRSISLPLSHESPLENSPEDAAYKNKWFEHGAKLFYKEFPVRGRR